MKRVPRVQKLGDEECDDSLRLKQGSPTRSAIYVYIDVYTHVSIYIHIDIHTHPYVCM